MAEDCLKGEEIFYPNPSASVFFQSQAQEGKWGPLIDSGASRTVVGLPRFQGWSGLTSKEELKLRKSMRVFKFGSRERFQSIWVRILIGSLGNSISKDYAEDMLAIEADVLELHMPFLLSQNTLSRLNGELNFPKKVMTLSGNIQAPLYVSKSGNIAFQWICQKETGEIAKQKILDRVYTSEDQVKIDEEEKEPMALQELGKLNIQTGHADFRR